MSMKYSVVAYRYVQYAFAPRITRLEACIPATIKARDTACETKHLPGHEAIAAANVCDITLQTEIINDCEVEEGVEFTSPSRDDSIKIFLLFYSISGKIAYKVCVNQRKGWKQMALPKMARIQQQFEAPVLDDLPTAIRIELERINAAAIVRPGETVAITAGSRGVANVDIAVKATVDALKTIGAKPFVVPAMGSHGGATPEGQRTVLEHYGITEETVGAPIKATMDVVQLGKTADGLPVFLGPLRRRSGPHRAAQPD